MYHPKREDVAEIGIEPIIAKLELPNWIATSYQKWMFIKQNWI
jgi:hypothetical protein